MRTVVFLWFCLACLGPAWAGQTVAVHPDAICGEWKQYAVQSNGHMVYLLTMRMTRTDKGYHAQLADLSANSSVRQIHTFNHQYDGKQWTFDSDWGKRGIAHFVLHPDTGGSGNWTGWSYLKGKPVTHNLWVHLSPH